MEWYSRTYYACCRRCGQCHRPPTAFLIAWLRRKMNVSRCEMASTSKKTHHFDSEHFSTITNGDTEPKQAYSTSELALTECISKNSIKNWINTVYKAHIG